MNTRLITLSIAVAAMAAVAMPPWKTRTPSMTLPPDIFVAPDGDDANPGTADRPLATLDAARLKVRQMKTERTTSRPVVVEFAAGTYRFGKTVSFTKEDSGSAGSPVVYRGVHGGEVRFTGSQPVSALKTLQDASVKALLPPESREKVMVADLSGFSDLGRFSKRGFGHGNPPSEGELFYDDRPMALSRWPKSGFIGVLRKLDDVNVILDAKGRSERWRAEKDPWIFAYYHFDWAELAEPILGFGPEKDQYRRDAAIKPTYGITPERTRCYVFNLLSELQEPGEYYIDRTDKKLYFIPPHEGGSVEISVMDQLFNAKALSHVHFENLTLENVRSSAFSIDGDHCEMTGCVIRNTGKNGGSFSGSYNLLYGCDIYHTGAGGVNLYGGDRKTLTPGHSCAENNHVHDYSRRARTYTTALRIDGCGNRMAHNLLHHGPHMALAAGGNNHVVEFNEIHNAVYESGDAGAYYVGRDWTQRGNILRCNYWHHIMGSSSYGGMTIYLDDQHCGHTIYGNLFERCNQAVFIGGGDDNIVDNNVFVDCWKAAHLDNRGMGWQKKATDDPNGELRRYLRNMPYQSELWAKAYPTLVNIMDDDPGVPKRNVFTRNVSAGGLWDDIHKGTAHLQTVRGNVVHDEDVEWISLKKDESGKVLSVEYKNPKELEAVGFEQIPVEKMGLYEDPRRASWPVVNPTDDVVLPHERPGQKKVVMANLSKMPTLKVPHGSRPVAAMELGVNYNGAVAENPAKALFALDGDVLKVAVETMLPAKRSLGDGWAGNDAVELAFMASDGATADIIVFRGFTSGKFEAFKLVNGKRVEAAGLMAATLKADVKEAAWSCEWNVPLELLGVTAGDRLRANVTVRRFGTNEFIMWRPTHGDSMNCDRVGFLELEK